MSSAASIRSAASVTFCPGHAESTIQPRQADS